MRISGLSLLVLFAHSVFETSPTVTSSAKAVFAIPSKEISNNPYVVDTVVIGRFTFPTCNYQQTDVTTTLQLKCSIGNRQTNFSREMYLDCIYLKPVSAAVAAETKSRKEVRR